MRLRKPLTDDAAMSRAVVPPSILASPLFPVVFNATAPVNALVVVLRVMSAPLALVVKEEVPAIVNAPESVMLPVVAVAAIFPPTVDAAKFNPASFTTVALPDPLVVSATVPSTASVPRLINPLFASVVATRLPPTVTVPLSVILLPLVRVKFPPTDD